MYRKILLISLCFLCWNSALFAVSVEDDISKLDQLASLEDEAYIAARDEFLQSRSSPVDLDQAIEKGWAEGLQGLILNARIADPNLFQSWDNTRITLDRSGCPSWHPRPSLGNSHPSERERMRYNLHVFLVEKVWKFKGKDWSIREPMNFHDLQSQGIWPRNLLEHYRTRIGIPGNHPLLVRKVEAECPIPSLLAAACATLTMDKSEEIGRLLKTRLKSPVQPEVKEAIMKGLMITKSPYATSILIDSYPNWKQDPNLVIHGFWAMVKQSGSEGQQFIREIMIDSAQPDYLRVPAINAISSVSSPNDFIHLQHIIESTDSVLLKSTILDAIHYRYSYSQTRPLANRILATENDPKLLSLALSIMGGSSSDNNDLILLETFKQRQDINDTLKMNAEFAIQHIQERLSNTKE